MGVKDQQIADWYDKAADEWTEHPERWTQNTGARDANGIKINPCYPEAVCWCIQGMSSRDRTWDLTYRDWRDRTKFNDTHTLPEVIAELRRRAAKLRQ